jgi:hypothetical protein
MTAVAVAVGVDVGAVVGTGVGVADGVDVGAIVGTGVGVADGGESLIGTAPISPLSCAAFFSAGFWGAKPPRT